MSWDGRAVPGVLGFLSLALDFRISPPGPRALQPVARGVRSSLAQQIVALIATPFFYLPRSDTRSHFRNKEQRDIRSSRLCCCCLLPAALLLLLLLILLLEGRSQSLVATINNESGIWLLGISLGTLNSRPITNKASPVGRFPGRFPGVYLPKAQGQSPPFETRLVFGI